MTDRTEAGFTLIEVLVALLVLAIAAAYAFQIAAGGFSWLTQASQEQDAMRAAESALSHLGHDVPVQPGSVANIDGSLHWSVEIGAALADPPPAQGLAAYPVIVDVQWADGRVKRHFRMKSVRLGAEPAAQ